MRREMSSDMAMTDEANPASIDDVEITPHPEGGVVVLQPSVILNLVRRDSPPLPQTQQRQVDVESGIERGVIVRQQQQQKEDEDEQLEREQVLSSMTVHLQTGVAAVDLQEGDTDEPLEQEKGEPQEHACEKQGQLQHSETRDCAEKNATPQQPQPGTQLYFYRRSAERDCRDSKQTIKQPASRETGARASVEPSHDENSLEEVRFQGRVPSLGGRQATIRGRAVCPGAVAISGSPPVGDIGRSQPDNLLASFDDEEATAEVGSETTGQLHSHEEDSSLMAQTLDADQVAHEIRGQILAKTVVAATIVEKDNQTPKRWRFIVLAVLLTALAAAVVVVAAVLGTRDSTASDDAPYYVPQATKDSPTASSSPTSSPSSVPTTTTCPCFSTQDIWNLKSSLPSGQTINCGSIGPSSVGYACRDATVNCGLRSKVYCTGDCNVYTQDMDRGCAILEEDFSKAQVTTIEVTEAEDMACRRNIQVLCPEP